MCMFVHLSDAWQYNYIFNIEFIFLFRADLQLYSLISNNQNVALFYLKKFEQGFYTVKHRMRRVRLYMTSVYTGHAIVLFYSATIKENLSAD